MGIADTAGRLHTQHNLMEELKKIRRVMSRIDETAPHETMLVVDAGTGQNALNQAREFHQAVQLSGITITKLDGTARGGVLANDFDYEGESLRLLTATGPANGSITALVTNGRFGYQPDPGFVGTDQFTYVMEDASGNRSAPGTVTIEVLPDPNHAAPPNKKE